MSTEPVREITEADVVAFLVKKSNEVKATFGPKEYGTVQIEVVVYGERCSDRMTQRVSVGSGALMKNYSGDTFAAAMKDAGGETPEKVAAAKREAAAKLLAEADALTATPTPSA